MATKHFFNAQTDGSGTSLVAKHLEGLVACRGGSLVLHPDNIVTVAHHEKAKVAVISGCGSGHEPGMAHFVGCGMLTAAVQGELFASPSTRQIRKALNMCSRSAGIILIIINYTGDMLHFGLAAQQHNASGNTPVRSVVVADDVAVGRSRNSLVGRRGLAGAAIVMKLIGAAAAAGLSLQECGALGDAIASNQVTVGSSLDHIHVPGRSQEYGSLTDDTLELGMGIHNEPGVRLISPIPKPTDLISEMLALLLDAEDTERAYVPVNDNDAELLTINNLGGVSLLELSAFTAHTVAILKQRYSICPIRVMQGTLISSLNAPGVSITLTNLTNVSRSTSTSIDRILEFYDAATDATAWPRTALPIKEMTTNAARLVETIEDEDDKPSFSQDLRLPAETEERLRLSCQNVISAEPMLTVWDTEMGDGDCGETLTRGVKSLLLWLDTVSGQSLSILSLLSRIVHICEEDMGGTLGAIFAIFFASYQKQVSERCVGKDGTVIQNVLLQSLAGALEGLCKYTLAREGDRTVMDVLIPFVQRVAEDGFESAVNFAKDKAEYTRRMVPKLGRGTYVGEGSAGTIRPPDPGAYGVYEILRGLNGQSYEEL
ncbi:dihydroxyacetone kinase [Kwoniella bestiolae CBS 10118]|uniref:Dihydroxyacetone kinase n=1 Tax=Kwoniella bestiolae CBS 10118 TaxID=1296100 RepID=A0A1B9GFR5_9TREE|nr:dihydroxyacetone kinase [Kwoniella bestiolae CBS 10118]OCF29869.1 dihydroxyacetone kinase [Kwoniella bestiolae CBS 10118]